MSEPTFDFATAIRLFDETTSALSAQVKRLEQVLTAKQAELVATNQQLTVKVGELDRLTAWLNLVMGSITSGVVAVDPRGVVTTCNEAACDALRGELSDLIGADYAAMFVNGPLARTLNGGRTEGPDERSVKGPDGQRRILRLKAAPIRDSNGRLLGAVEVIDDITALRQYQEQAERTDRLKRLGEMAAGVAHEIRNPLNGIEGFASMLAKDLPTGSREARYAQAVVDGVRDLNRTVSGLLEFTRVRRIERRPCEPLALIQGVVELLGSELPAHVALVVDDRWSMLRNGELIQIDGPQIRQVLLNLVQNAIHAVSEREPSGGRVHITVADAGDRGAVISVDDDGPGVPVAERNRIFTPFHTTREQGTGLGLAMSLAIVQLHGGTITVDESPLGGARFAVSLP